MDIFLLISGKSTSPSCFPPPNSDRSIINVSAESKSYGKRGFIYFLFMVAQWLICVFLAAPPMLGVAGRFYYTPSGTTCTIDYWHGDFRHYNLYILALVVLGFSVPIVAS